MADENENISEEDAGEDVPSNFFDDFDKDDFLEGLQVIDSLHEDDEKEPASSIKEEPIRRSTSSSRIDEYIKPGSRRDPEKTNAAILRDKEVKVKEHLAKHLESQDDLRPPGTELDDYFDEGRSSVINKVSPKNESSQEERWSEPKEHEYPDPPRWRSPPVHTQWRGHRVHWHGSHRSPRYYPHYSRHNYRNSPGRSPRRSPQYSLRRSPYYRSRHSPRRSPRRSPRYSPRRFSRRSPRRSPRNSPSRGSRLSPRYSPRASPGRNSRYSPQRNHRRSPHRSPRHSIKHSPHRSPRRCLQHDKRNSPLSPRKRSPSQNKPHWSPRRSPPPVLSHTEHFIPQPDLNVYNPQFNQQQYNPEMSAPYPYTYIDAYNPYAVQPIPTSMPLTQSLPPTMSIPQSLPPTMSIPQSLPPTMSIPQTLPPNIPIPQSLPPNIPIPQSLPPNMPIPQSLPPNMPIPTSLPPNMSITQSLPPNMPMQHPVPPSTSMPQPVPMPINPVSTSKDLEPNPVSNFILPDAIKMVPPPPLPSSVVPQATSLPNPTQPIPGVKAPYDALAQLVADGKLSKEDYLKLTPSIKGGNSMMDDKTRITVLNRCSHAAEKLNKLIYPFRFTVEKKKFNNVMLSLPKKYASPLKRQVPVEFEFTKPAEQSSTQNKRLINNIVATIGLEKGFRKTKVSKEVKSVGVQTTKPFCDLCEIRDSREMCDVGVSTEALIGTNSVHTQIVEQDLLTSNAIFNPRRSVGDSSPISIARLTPAQLVSQLAARAKTFQLAEPPSTSNQYPRQTTPNTYDDRGGGHRYHSNPQHRY